MLPKWQFPLPSFYNCSCSENDDFMMSPKQMLVLNVHFSNYHIELEPKYSGVRFAQLLFDYRCVSPFICGKGVNKSFLPAVKMLFMKGYNVKFIL